MMWRDRKFKKSVWGASCIAAQPLLLNTLSLPVMAYTVRSLGATAFGQWATATALITAVSVLTNLGLRGLFVRDVARWPDTADDATAEQLSMRPLLAAFAAIIALLLCWGLGYGRVVFLCTVLACVGMLLNSIATVAADLLQALHQLPAVAAANLAGGLTLIGVTVLALRCGAGPVVLSAAYLVGPTISAILLLALIHRRHFKLRLRFNLATVWRRLRESRAFAAQQLAGAAGANAAALMLPKLVGAADFGYFTAGGLPANRLTVAPDGLATAFYPSIAAAHERSPQAAARQAVGALVMAVLICSATAAALALAAGPVGRLLFPASATACTQVMLITSLSLPAVAAEMLMGAALNAAGRDAAQAKVSIISAALSLAATVVLVVSGGLVGASWAVVVRPCIKAALLLPDYWRMFLRPVVARDANSVVVENTRMSESVDEFSFRGATPVSSA